jgi:hypothetical protein
MDNGMEWIMAWNTLYDVKFCINKEPLMVMTLLEATGLQRGCQPVATFPWGLCWLHFPKPPRSTCSEGISIAIFRAGRPLRKCYSHKLFESSCFPSNNTSHDDLRVVNIRRDTLVRKD